MGKQERFIVDEFYRVKQLEKKHGINILANKGKRKNKYIFKVLEKYYWELIEQHEKIELGEMSNG
jgi:hypothetical protein